MRDFFKEYILEIVSSIVLLLSLILLFFKVYYNPLVEYSHTISKLSSSLQSDELRFTKKLYELNKEDDFKSRRTDFNVLPSFLIRINDTCKKSNVTIDSLVPYTDEQFHFKLEFTSTYFDFLRVLSEFEKLDIMINNINIKPNLNGDKSTEIEVSLDILAIDGGEKLTASATNFLNKELSKKYKRNPFQQYTKLGSKTNRLINLTWVYKLSGIGRVNSNFVATINHSSYFVGDLFFGMKITSINRTSVLLERDGANGVMNYVLKFRIKKTKEKKANDE